MLVLFMLFMIMLFDLEIGLCIYVCNVLHIECTLVLVLNVGFWWIINKVVKLCVNAKN